MFYALPGKISRWNEDERWILASSNIECALRHEEYGEKQHVFHWENTRECRVGIYDALILTRFDQVYTGKENYKWKTFSYIN